MLKLFAAIAVGFVAGGIVHAESAVSAPAIVPAPIVFFDIAGPDAGALKTFYAKNFGWSIDGANGITAANLKGTLRQDPPETLIYLGVPNVDAALAAIVASGGSVALPKMTVPHVATFAIFKDPAGNRMGLVETLHS
jgi:predicted enzyme related to lactoylglutathione lyase